MLQSGLVASGPGPVFGILAALSSALAWTLITLLARTLATRVPSLSLNIVRSAVGSLFLIPAALVAGDPKGLHGLTAGAWVSIVVSVLVALGVGDTAYLESAKTLGLARAVTISTAGYPLVAGALAIWWFGERLTLAAALGCAVTLGGLALMVSEQHAAPAAAAADPEARRRGLALATIAALSWGIGAALMKSPLREIDPLTIQAIRMPLTTLVLWTTPWARGTARGLWAHRRAVAPAVLALGALTALSAVGYLVGIKYAGVTLGTVVSSVSPLFALPIGLLVLGERVTWRAAAGAGLTVAGIAALSL